jgi:hypothetical protein
MAAWPDLIYDLNECGCSLAVQLVPILAVPFGSKFVCAASAGIIELVRRNPVEVFAGLAVAGLLLWRSVIGDRATNDGGIPWNEAPRYMIRDRDRIYGIVVTRRLRAMGIRDKPTAPASPWQNACAA